MITIKKINKVKIKPIDIQRIDDKKIKGKELFNQLYFLCAIFAKKKSGKTTIVNKIIDSCTNKLTTVIFFVGSGSKDASYDSIRNKLNERGIVNLFYDSFKDGEGDHLEQVINYMKCDEEEDEDSAQHKKIKHKFVKFESDSEEEEKPRKPKKLAPEFLIIIDDMGQAIRNKKLAQLLKIHRHCKASIVLSTQNIKDLEPQQIEQLDTILLLRNIPMDRLEYLHNKSNLATPLNTFLDLYKNATKEKYNFLYIDTVDETYRKNFNHQYNLNKM